MRIISVVFLVLLCVIESLAIAGPTRTVAPIGLISPIVGIGDQSSVSCGGTLVASKYVVTAAHCFSGSDVNNPGNFGVSIGKVDITKSSPGTYVTLSAINRHPNFSGSSGTEVNDVAVLTLSTPVLEDGTNIMYAQVPTTNTLSVGQSMTVAGWGYLDTSSTTTTHLYAANINVLSASSCTQIWSNFNNNEQICAGATNGNTPCDGDSGGPLLYRNSLTDTRWTLAGIISDGTEFCGSQGNSVGYYTRISNYLPFIESITGPLITVGSASPSTPVSPTNAPTPTTTIPTPTDAPTTFPTPTPNTNVKLSFSISLIIFSLFLILG